MGGVFGSNMWVDDNRPFKIPDNAPGIEGNAWNPNNDDINTIDVDGPDDD